MIDGWPILSPMLGTDSGLAGAYLFGSKFDT
jgi:hypothetical protein